MAQVKAKLLLKFNIIKTENEIKLEDFNKLIFFGKNYVNEINLMSKSGTKLFIMWIDSSKIDKNELTNDYYSYNETNNELTVNLPHREKHIEPCLHNQIFESFNNHSKNSNKWVIDNNIMESTKTGLEVEKIKLLKLKIYNYIKLINYIVITKL
jgi:hypothetical protein